MHGVRLVTIGEDGRQDDEEGSDAAREGRDPPPHCVGVFIGERRVVAGSMYV